MELLNSFMGQGMIAQIGEIVLFANTVTMAMPTRAFDSQITRKYMRVREDSMMDVFWAIGGNG
jgi:hypothetical protein